MRILLLLFLASAAWGSDSFVNAASGRRATITFPGGSPMCSNTNSFRIEGHFYIPGGFGTIGTNQEFVRQENNWGFLADSTGNIGTYAVSGGGGGFALTGLSAWKYMRIRWQRDTALTRYSFEIWNEETGERVVDTAADPSPGAITFGSCLIYLGSNTATNTALVNLGAFRIYSTTVPLDSAPPVRLLTSGFADVLDLELETNLTDSSGRGLTTTMTSGSAAYTTTPSLPPVSSITAPTTVRAGEAAALVTSCLSNEDSPTCSLFWTQLSSPNGAFGTWTNRTSASSATFTPPVSGQSDLSVTASTTTQSASTLISIGASATDVNNVVIMPESTTAEIGIKAIVGPIIRNGGNPWDWFDDRALAAAQLQIDQQTGANGAGNFWSDQWSGTPLAGTVSVTGSTTKGAGNGSATITGSGTTFQTDFCAGGTTPTAPYKYITIWYEMDAYPGEMSKVTLEVLACTDQTHLTIYNQWGFSEGTHAGLNYTKTNSTISGWWKNTDTPGNYYDNVLSFYVLYYRTGLTKYRTAARTLASNWWYGPFYNRGKNYDTAAMSGCCIAAGPARGQSITGLILWALDTGEDIWPGLVYVMTYQKDIGWTFMNTRGWTSANVQLGDLREQAYALAAYALNSRFNPDSATRTLYRGYTKDYINLLLEPMQFATGEWRWTSIQNISIAGSSHVTVTNSSTTMTAVGTDWAPSQFTVGSTPFTAWVWLFTNYSNHELPGKQNSDLGGDSVYYRVVSMPVAGDTTAILVLTDISGSWSPGNTVTQASTGATGTVVTYDAGAKRLYLSSVSGTFLLGDSVCAGKDIATGGNTAKVCQVRYTTAVLNSNYAGTTGSKGANVSSIVGFGNQPFMQALLVGVLATYVRDAMIYHGDTTEAGKALTMATLGAEWLTSTDAYKSSEHFLYGASLFLNCVTDPNSTGCAGGTILNAEGMRGQSAVYILNPSAPVLAQGDALYNAIWCPPSGWTCPIASYGTYGDYYLDYPDGYMMNPADPLINKWFGFSFGYGFGASWPVARVGGITPKTTTAKPIKARLADIAAAVDIVVDYLAADGTVDTSSPCTSSACTFATDARQGYLYRVRYRNGSAVTLATGQYQEVR